MRRIWSFRSVLAAAAFLSIAAGSFNAELWRAFTAGRAEARAALTELPFAQTPGLRTFLEEVRLRTHEGERIALLIPAAASPQPYRFHYVRAAYLLAGRQTVPLVDDAGRPLIRNLEQADAIASWRANPPVPGFRVAWTSREGVLLRRIR